MRLPRPDKSGLAMTALLAVIARREATKQSVLVCGILVEDRKNGKGAGFPAPFGFVAFALLFGFSRLINWAASLVVVS